MENQIMTTSTTVLTIDSNMNEHQDNTATDASLGAEYPGLEWRDGIGYLPESDFKFRKNAEGGVEMITDDELEEKPMNLIQSANYNTGQSFIPTNHTTVIKENGFKMPDSMPAPCPNVSNDFAFHNFGNNTDGISTVACYAPYNPVRDAKIKVESSVAIYEKHENIGFNWDSYLKKTDSVAVPETVFEEIAGRNPFPPPNAFLVGDLLECVDPLHQSFICVVSVVEVRGARMRLHFDGYSTLHDFWVNSTNTLLFPCGFCKKTGRYLHPPKDHDPETFKWKEYEKNTGKAIADEGKFRFDYEKCFEQNTKFDIGQKMEAVDKQNLDLTCVATITDIIDNEILIHFDGWNHNFDYWCTKTSNYIHPVGWCQEVGKTLSVPQDYGDSENFIWTQYLEDTKSKAAPEDAFAPRTSHGMEIGMKLEVVDKRNPILVRVATVADKNSYQIKIHFDGWDKMYDYWMDVDSPDLHPVGWCAHSRHILQPNISEEDGSRWQSGCPIRGCRGLGHIKGSKFLGHHSEYGCPYSSKNLDSYPIQDRITPRRGPKPSSIMSRRILNPAIEKEKTNSAPELERRRSTGIRRASRHSFQGTKDQNEVVIPLSSRNSNAGDEPPEKQRAVEPKKEVLSDGWPTEGRNLYYSFYCSTLWSSVPNKQLAIYWQQCTRLLPGVKGVRASNVCKWTAKDVAKFVEKLTGEEKYGKMFLNEEIDGEAFLLLTQNDIYKVLHIKLGPTLKIHSAILYARANE